MTVAVVGAGSWGTTLAHLLAQEHRVVLWCRSAERAEEIRRHRTNSTFLPGIRLHERIVPTTDPADLAAAELTFLAIPTQHLRSAIQRYRLRFPLPVVNVAKGIEQGTCLRVSELLRELLDVPAQEYAIVSGPSHAEEVIRELPTAVVVASESAELARAVQELLTRPSFRVYTSGDVVGVELGGALKNVIAIAAGIADGLGFGDNTKAALITRGLAEIQRLGITYGAEPQTFAGLSGLGDLVATCMSRYSRNRAVGERLARGEPLELILASTPMVAEGVPTARSAYELSRRAAVEMPIVEQVHAILFERKDPKVALQELLLRSAKPEYWWEVPQALLTADERRQPRPAH